MPFTAADGTGTIAISGDNSPVAAWLANQPGEVSLDLVDADVDEPVSVVEELVSFWFFRDGSSGDAPPLIYEAAGGEIADSLGTRYVVAAQGLPPAPGTEPATAPAVSAITTAAAVTSAPSSTPPASSVPSEIPEASVPPATTSTTTAAPTTTEPAAPVSAVPVTADLSPAELQVRVLNGSGVAGAAGRLSDRLQDSGYSVLPAANAPGRFRASAVYYVAAEHRDEAELVAEVVAGSDVEVARLPVSGQITSDDANVVVLIGRDALGDSLRTAERTGGLRRTPDFDTPLPLAADIPRDRYVPGLADIQIFTETNDGGTDEMKGILNAVSGWFNIAGRYQSLQLTADREEHQDYEYLRDEVYPNIEAALEWLGFTPQNVCGAPEGYSFTDLIKPTREFSEESQSHKGDAIFTTDRLIELHGGQRINPEANLEFYIQQAVQTAYDALRLAELLDETEAPQLILCRAFLAPSGEVPEFANGAWYALLTPGIQPRESLLSQGTYHVKEISRNGNYAYVVVCHPTIGNRQVRLYWREAGYRAEVVGPVRNNGCQAGFEKWPYIRDDTDLGEVREDTITFVFGERVFSAGDLQGFPRP